MRPFRDASHPIHSHTLPSGLTPFFPLLFFPLVYLKCLTGIFLGFYDAPPPPLHLCSTLFLLPLRAVTVAERGLQGPRKGGCESRTILLMTFNEIHKACRKTCREKKRVRERERWRGRNRGRDGRRRDGKKKKKQHHPPPS